MRFKLMRFFFLMIFFSVLRQVSCWQMANDSLIAWPCKGLVQVDSLDTTLSTVGTMPSIPEDGIAARDRWFEDIPSHWSGMLSLWKQVWKLGTCYKYWGFGRSRGLPEDICIYGMHRGCLRGTAFMHGLPHSMMEVFHQKQAISLSPSLSDIFTPVVFVSSHWSHSVLLWRIWRASLADGEGRWHRTSGKPDKDAKTMMTMTCNVHKHALTY